MSEKPSTALVRLNLTKTESVAARVRRLQDEARNLARDHVRSLVDLLTQVQGLSGEIAEGGDAYPPGVRDLARRLVEDMEMKAQTLEAIVSRT